ncbi:MAG: hypothetical protein D3907_02945 [Candidatus Electrothrix sp. AUS3]|nr:hypothetical protein [Candidatus Electrothrix gigas]
MKLVAAGCRNRISGGLYRVGTGGGYWSSTGADMVAKNLCFDSGYFWGGNLIVPTLCFAHIERVAFFEK